MELAFLHLQSAPVPLVRGHLRTLCSSQRAKKKRPGNIFRTSRLDARRSIFLKVRTCTARSSGVSNWISSLPSALAGGGGSDGCGSSTVTPSKPMSTGFPPSSAIATTVLCPRSFPRQQSQGLALLPAGGNEAERPSRN